MSEGSDGARTDDLLRILVQLSARQALPEAAVRKVVGGSTRQLQAYNLCDGTRSQSEVTKVAKLDSGNFSRTVTRWIQFGVLFRLGTGREAKLLHLYPLAKEKAKRTAGQSRR
jgi:hypothetical protein